MMLSKRLNMMKWIKKLTILKLPILVVVWHKKICQIGSQIPDHDHAKCVTTDKFSKIKVDNFNTILKIMIFDDKLKNLNKSYSK